MPNFHGSQIYFDFYTLFTSLPLDLIKAKVLNLVICVSTESKKGTSDKALGCFFLPTRSITHIEVYIAQSSMKLLPSSWKNIHVQFNCIVCQQVVRFSMSTTGVSLITDLFLQYLCVLDFYYTSVVVSSESGACKTCKPHHFGVCSDSN